jgi:hypothetical protein
MSSIGILSSNLVSGAAQEPQSCQNTPSALHQIAAEFQQLGQDLQTCNGTASPPDLTTLSKNLSTLLQVPAAVWTTKTDVSSESAMRRDVHSTAWPIPFECARKF